jgi:hypothetical protein
LPGRIRVGLVVAALLSLLGAQTAAATEPFSYDPVHELRLVLKAPCDTSPNAPGLEQRRQALHQRVAVLCRIPELREALLLQDWRDQDTEEAIAAIDRSARLELVHRFEEAAGDVLRQGDTISRLAAANMLGEVAATMQKKGDRHLFFRPIQGLGPLLAELVRGKDHAVREAAARALGQIDPDPVVAVTALVTLLEAPEPSPRRVAAAALVNLVKSAAQGIRRHNGITTDTSRG